MRMTKEKEKLKDQENVEEILEFLKSARMLKRQIKLIKGINLTERENQVISEVLGQLKNEFSLFKM